MAFLIIFCCAIATLIVYVWIEKQYKTSYKRDPELRKVRSLADEYKQIAFNYDARAYGVATEFGIMEKYSANRGKMLKDIIDNASEGRTSDEELTPIMLYYVFGISDKIEKLADDENNIEIATKKQQCFTIIKDFPINEKKSLNEYIDFVVELCKSKTDKHSFDAIKKYGAKIPEKLRYLEKEEQVSADDLMNLAAQNAFYSVPVAIIESNSKYFKKGFPHLEFALYYFFIFQEVFLSAEIDEEKKEHFKQKMKQHYIEYALRMNLVKTKKEAENVFFKRHTWYCLINADYDGDEKTLKIADALIKFTMNELKLPDDSYIDVLEEVGELLAVLNDKAKPLYENLLEIYETESFFGSVNSSLEGAIQHLEEYAENMKSNGEEESNDEDNEDDDI